MKAVPCYCLKKERARGAIVRIASKMGADAIELSRRGEWGKSGTITKLTYEAIAVFADSLGAAK